MPDAGHGFIKAVTGVVVGLVVNHVLSGFISSGYLDPSMLIVYELANILAIFAFVHVSPYWGTGYLFGWWFGLGIMYQAGLVGALEFALYSVLSILVLVKRAYRRAVD